MQNRWGPTRVGPFGLLQPLADGIKFIFKEDLTPPTCTSRSTLLAPMHRRWSCALISIAVIPFGDSGHDRRQHPTPLQITDVNIGLLVILGVTSIGVYGIALSGWSSNNKYSLLGSLARQRADGQLRARARLVAGRRADHSRVASACATSSTRKPSTWWHSFRTGISFGGQFVAFFIYLMAAFAETNRIPFDLPEAETELVAGYHTEYSSMKFAMFFMAEYANMITVGCVWPRCCFSADGTARLFGPRRSVAGDSADVLVRAQECLLFCFSTSGCAARCRASAMTS